MREHVFRVLLVRTLEAMLRQVFAMPPLPYGRRSKKLPPLSGKLCDAREQLRCGDGFELPKPKLAGRWQVH